MPKALTDWDDDALDLLEDERPVARPRREWPWLRMLILSSVIVAGLVHLAQQDDKVTPDEPQGPREIPVATLTAPAPAWTAIDRPNALFTIEKSTPSIFEARRHSSGGRADTLTFGNPGEPGFARLTFTVNLQEARRTLYVDLVRRAAEASLSVVRNAQSEIIATKFGPIETASITLADRREQSCRAFRLNDDENGFSFLGWRCGSDMQPPDDAQLACFIDAITLTDASDATLKSVFAQAERRRLGFCPPGSRTAAIGGAKTIARP
ncbi:hypothetical protein AB4072_12565 [Microvirga sp. 2MCAF38]|uniref:hypothetical protein n=1 Tax=Microvirga sp. 2MCAF38 TaxID=3232989 RepID=UPI003F977E9C